MIVRIPVEPQMLAWALERSGVSVGDPPYERFARWAAGEGPGPTFKQLEKFARATHAPLGYLFLSEPPVETVPIPDFRTLSNRPVTSPSADLLDTIYGAELRQDWYKSFALEQAHDPLPFVGSARIEDAPEIIAERIRLALDFGMERRGRFKTWQDALRELIDSVEKTGVLVMLSGIVGSNTRRVLKPKEFRGFALTNPLAALIFVNGADTKSAQMFTLVHELAHVWLGESALSDAEMAQTATNDHELWANKVAAEVLVPMSSLKAEYRKNPDRSELDRLARIYKVSSLVVLKRIFDAGFLTWVDYQKRYDDEHERLMKSISGRKSGGGNYYNTQPLRIGRTFARAVIVSAMEGRTLYRDAFSLLGSAKRSTFDRLARELGVA